jgi:hypothetical protein
LAEGEARAASCAEEEEGYPRAEVGVADSVASSEDREQAEPRLAVLEVAVVAPVPVVFVRLCSFEGWRRFERAARGRRYRPIGRAATGTTSGSRL